MRKISADYIYPISSEPIKNGVIHFDEDGTILKVGSKESGNTDDIEYFKGIICPGFINTHCHLELSHMRAQIPEKLGMARFIKEIIYKRAAFTTEEIDQRIIEAETEMINNGIVAVGDISNNDSTFKQKTKGKLAYQTFIEVFALDPSKSEEVFENALNLKKKLLDLNLSGSIVPHAPYSVSDQLHNMIAKEAIKNSSILSLHNQESFAEGELFKSKSGDLFDTFSKMGINMEFIAKTGLSSLKTTFPKLPSSLKTLLVHNTFTSKEDIEFATSINDNIYWCTCPNANLYIENKLPNYNLFIDKNAKTTIGTDSLSSNWSLSVLDELKTIAKYNPEIPLQTMLLWATKNGADFLGFDQLGTIEKGKKPGLNLLTDVIGGRLTVATAVKSVS